MQKTSKINRRSLITVGAGTAASAVATGILGSQTQTTPPNPEGPFYPKRPQVDKDTDLTLIQGNTERAQGQVIRVTGRVKDNNGQPVEGALVEIWQANSFGRYHHEDDPATTPLDPNFQGWGMVKTDADGNYSFTTIKPGAYLAEEGWVRPPHIHYKVARRGYRELTTQMYFSGESLNETDRLFLDVDAESRALLVVDFNEIDGIQQGDFPIVLAKV